MWRRDWEKGGNPEVSASSKRKGQILSEKVLTGPVPALDDFLTSFEPLLSWAAQATRPHLCSLVKCRRGRCPDHMHREDRLGLSSGFLGRGGTCGFSYRELFGLFPLAAHWGCDVALPGLARLRLSIENSGPAPGASSHEVGREPGAWRRCRWSGRLCSRNLSQEPGGR